MPYFKMDDPDFWTAPGRLGRIQDNRAEFLADRAQAESEAGRTLTDMRSVQFPLGDPEDDATPVANLVSFPPLFPLPRHTHDCDVYMVIVAGSMYADGRILEPGDGMTAKAFEVYGPEVAGPAGCTRVEFFASMSGMLDVIYRLVDGGEVHTRGLDDAGIVDPRKLEGVDELRALMRAARADAAEPPAT